MSWYSLSRLCVLIASVALLMIGAFSPAVGKPKLDGIVGSGTAGTGTFTIDAAESKKGAASGRIAFSLGIGSLQSEVLGVTVRSASEGCVTARITQSDIDGAPVGTVLILHVAEANPDHGDLIRLELTGTDTFSPECTLSLLSPAAVTTGDVEVVNGIRP